MSKQFASAIFAMLLLLSVGSPAMGQVQVYNDPVRFDILAKAPAVPIPDSQQVFPGTSCGAQPPVGKIGSGAQVVLQFGSNRVTITSPSGQVLCIFDGGSLISNPYGNTEPSFMTANTIVADTQKDLRFVFDHPVQAVAFRLLTNNVAHEVVNFKDIGGGIFSTINIDRFTPRNDRAFIGFISKRPIKEIVMVINRGIEPAGQNEGIDAIKVGETLAATAAGTDQLSSSEELQLLGP